jgi:hypothetical protein
MTRDGADTSPGARRIGPVGTVVRTLGGLGLIYLAGAVDGLPWDVDWYDPIVGFVVLPLIMVAVGLGVRRYASRPIRLTGPLGTALNLALIVALVSTDYTAGGAILFYGASMLVAAWLGQPGCETTVVSNLVLRRDDQIGCPTLFPIDECEPRRVRAISRRAARLHTGSRWPG